MNGAHDMGGVHGFGPVEPEPNEPVFHAEWEKRVLALTIAMGATKQWNVDSARFARENRPPIDYLTKSYYEIWGSGLERLLIEHGFISKEELEQGRVLHPPKPVKTVSAADIAKGLNRGEASGRDTTAPARFKIGERVRARIMNPLGHTRLPRYVRGHVGTIDSLRGCHVLPDTHAHGKGDDGEWLYTVRFDGRTLWGPDSDPTLTVFVDAWESYLEPA
ncbi:MAG TPA: nitrile hydratase subunit beta [Xanthobacteraceae bacterium]|jgi:nitrile hydratase|nr:nitrile hydratase subunit beta [Xanthobacteraceae bacterium]